MKSQRQSKRHDSRTKQRKAEKQKAQQNKASIDDKANVEDKPTASQTGFVPRFFV